MKYNQKLHDWLRYKPFTRWYVDVLLDEIERLQAELAHRDEKIAELQFKLDSLCPCIDNPQDEHSLLVDAMCPIHGHPQQEIHRRDEIITRLKEDAERLALEIYTDNGDYSAVEHCVYCGKTREPVMVKKSFEWLLVHTPDCPITLHRALMKEINNE